MEEPQASSKTTAEVERCGQQGARGRQHLQFIISIELETKTQAAQICGVFSSRHESHDKRIMAGESRSWSKPAVYVTVLFFTILPAAVYH